MTKQLKIQFKNRTLYDRYRNFIIASFQELDKNIINGELNPQTSRETTSIKENYSNSAYSEQEPNLRDFIYRHENKIKQLPECDSCIKFVTQDPVTKYKGKVTDSKGNPVKNHDARFIHESNLLDFLRLFVEKTKSFNFDNGKFIEFYTEYEEFLYNDEEIYESFSHLVNFQSEVDEIDLGSELIIKKISNEEIKEFRIASGYNTGHVTRFDLIGIKYLIKLKYTIKKGEPQSDEIPKDRFKKVIFVLRLLKEGVIGFNSILSSSSIWNPTGTIVSGSNYKKNYMGSKYKLMEFEIEDFKKLWAEYNNLNLQDLFWLNIAISKFNYIYDRERLEDKLIDCMIAFEALFSEGSADLSYKIPIRVARLLETEFKQRKNAYIIIKAGYNARSKLVHGSKQIKHIDLKYSDRKERILLADFIPKIVEYLRKSLKEIMIEVGKGKDKTDILERIDFCSEIERQHLSQKINNKQS